MPIAFSLFPCHAVAYCTPDKRAKYQNLFVLRLWVTDLEANVRKNGAPACVADDFKPDSRLRGSQIKRLTVDIANVPWC